MMQSLAIRKRNSYRNAQKKHLKVSFAQMYAKARSLSTTQALQTPWKWMCLQLKLVASLNCQALTSVLQLKKSSQTSATLKPAASLLATSPTKINKKLVLATPTKLKKKLILARDQVTLASPTKLNKELNLARNLVRLSPQHSKP